ncbi:hypothetical protein EUGRSUZ_G02295 [Eucalyptus grandis]|uniref:Uncharacterized protein n=2 Tax=Eucalyptus grandis TaxID=71139 RepID=A0ACC3K593_EUCGR|nr:hypothetical protein EUGRSUZ_G02295 [Eucalyptus grandis]
MSGDTEDSSDRRMRRGSMAAVMGGDAEGTADRARPRTGSRGGSRRRGRMASVGGECRYLFTVSCANLPLGSSRHRAAVMWVAGVGTSLSRGFSRVAVVIRCSDGVEVVGSVRLGAGMASDSVDSTAFSSNPTFPPPASLVQPSHTQI